MAGGGEGSASTFLVEKERSLLNVWGLSSKERTYLFTKSQEFKSPQATVVLTEVFPTHIDGQLYQNVFNSSVSTPVSLIFVTMDMYKSIAETGHRNEAQLPVLAVFKNESVPGYIFLATSPISESLVVFTKNFGGRAYGKQILENNVRSTLSDLVYCVFHIHNTQSIADMFTGENIFLLKTRSCNRGIAMLHVQYKPGRSNDDTAQMIKGLKGLIGHFSPPEKHPAQAEFNQVCSMLTPSSFHLFGVQVPPLFLTPDQKIAFPHIALKRLEGHKYSTPVLMKAAYNRAANNMYQSLYPGQTRKDWRINIRTNRGSFGRVYRHVGRGEQKSGDAKYDVDMYSLLVYLRNYHEHGGDRSLGVKQTLDALYNYLGPEYLYVIYRAVFIENVGNLTF